MRTAQQQGPKTLRLPVAALAAAVCLMSVGCGVKTSKSPTTPPTQAILSNPQASAAAKAQASQQLQLGQRQQRLMQQTHPAPPGQPQ